MNKLPIEFKEKWLAALRSGEYKQGTGGSLCDKIGLSDENKTYCCIGVACHVFTGEDPFDTLSGYIDGDLEKSLLQKGFPKMLIGSGAMNEIVKRLAQMNDGMGDYSRSQKSFSEIADWIEANL